MDFENFYNQITKLYFNNIDDAPNMHMAFLKFLYTVPLDPIKKGYVINEQEMENIRQRILDYLERLINES